jgi:hypothetical protein
MITTSNSASRSTLRIARTCRATARHRSHSDRAQGRTSSAYEERVLERSRDRPSIAASVERDPKSDDDDERSEEKLRRDVSRGLSLLELREDGNGVRRCVEWPFGRGT